MAADESKPLVFLTEYYDQQAGLQRRYRLKFFPDDNSVEMFDLKNHRVFLKRVPYPDVRQGDLRVGATVTVFSRQLRVVDLADSHTRKALSGAFESTLALVNARGYEAMGRVAAAVAGAGYTVSRARLVRLGGDQAAALAGVRGEAALALAQGPALALEVTGKNAASWWASQAAAGVAGAPPAALYASPSAADAARDAAFVFDRQAVPTTAEQGEHSTVCVVRPHAVADGKLGAIVDAVLEDGYEVTALDTFTLDRVAAGEFLEVYRTVVPEYHALVSELSSGACVALELRSDARAVETFRELCGPPDPEVAQRIRPKSLRARFGTDKVRNAVHCTDLPEDGRLEAEFFFSIL